MTELYNAFNSMPVSIFSYYYSSIEYDNII